MDAPGKDHPHAPPAASPACPAAPGARLGPVTHGPAARVNHWVVAAAFLGALGLGLAIGQLPREARGALMDPHRALGVAVLLWGAWRLLLRLRTGFPDPVAPSPRWQDALSRTTHWALLAATVLIPLSGVLMGLARARALDVWGLTLLPALPETPWLASAAVHEAAAPVLLALVALHVGAALKHHFWDRDATLVRMLTGRTER